MARNVQRDELEMERRKNQLMDAGFDLFSQYGIESVSLMKVAEVAGVGAATLYNYYQNKVNLVTAISARKWSQVWENYRETKKEEDTKDKSAYRMMEEYAEAIIGIYREHPEILRFSSDYKTFISREHVGMDQVGAQFDALQPVSDLFHVCYEKAQIDGTIRTDIPEHELFTTVALTMLGMAERYAQGLVWANRADNEYTRELTNLKDMLLLWLSNK